MLKKFTEMDNRILYLVLLIVVIGPLLKPLGIPIEVTGPTQSFADAVEALNPEIECWYSTTPWAAGLTWILRLVFLPMP